jgi:hypothetical protein
MLQIERGNVQIACKASDGPMALPLSGRVGEFDGANDLAVDCDGFFGAAAGEPEGGAVVREQDNCEDENCALGER